MRRCIVSTGIVGHTEQRMKEDFAWLFRRIRFTPERGTGRRFT